MANFVKGLFGNKAASSVTVSGTAPTGDADFADYAGAPDPSPASLTASTAPLAASTPTPSSFGAHISLEGRPYTKWYNVHERVTWHDFRAELTILPVLIALVLSHVWGSRRNRRLAQSCFAAHLPALESEYAVVGFGGPGEKMREKTRDIYVSYATGRQNVAYLDYRVTLFKRYNPVGLVGEFLLSFFFESFAAPEEKLELTAHAFDGREGVLVPSVPSGAGPTPPPAKDSAYDGFVFAVVHKDHMKRLRDERFDLSLTTTKDHVRLPPWASVMSENAEITDALLTVDLAKAVEAAGDDLESLIVSDMPAEAPAVPEDLVPRKRVTLTLRLPPTPTDEKVPHAGTAALTALFLRLPDKLAQSAHFRPEVTRRLRATRDEEGKKLSAAADAEKEEDRKAAADRAKREARDAKLKRLSADEQRRFLEREREKENRRKMAKRSVRA